MIAPKLFDRLISVGQQKGYIDVYDLAAVLPLDEMSPVELSDVLRRLDESGVSVKIDDALSAGQSRSRPHMSGLKPDTLDNPDRDSFEDARASSVHARKPRTGATGGVNGHHVWLMVAAAAVFAVVIFLWLVGLL